MSLSRTTLKLLVQSYMYINSWGGTAGTYSCKINVNSQQANFISGCTSSTAYGNMPEGMTLRKGLANESNQVFIAQTYVNGGDYNAISKCSINRSTGVLTCANSTNFLNSPGAGNDLVVTSDNILYLSMHGYGIWKSAINNPTTNIYAWTTNYFTANIKIYQLAQNPYKPTDYIGASYGIQLNGPLYYCRSSGCTAIQITNNPEVFKSATFADPANNPNIVYIGTSNKGIYRCTITGTGFIYGYSTAMTCDTTPTVATSIYQTPSLNISVYGSYLYFGTGANGTGATTKCMINPDGKVNTSSCIASSQLVEYPIGTVVF